MIMEFNDKTIDKGCRVLSMNLADPGDDLVDRVTLHR